MTELLSYDEDAREAVASVHLLSSLAINMKAGVINRNAIDSEPYATPWPICGDELTKRGMK